MIPCAAQLPSCTAHRHIQQENAAFLPCVSKPRQSIRQEGTSSSCRDQSRQAATHRHAVVLRGRHEGDVEVDIALQNLAALIDDALGRVPDHHLEYICVPAGMLSCCSAVTGFDWQQSRCTMPGSYTLTTWRQQSATTTPNMRNEQHASMRGRDKAA